jgi:peroxiredoxin
MLQKGASAPDFELFCTPDQKIRLSELDGKKVILAFYPADWSPFAVTRWRCTMHR